MANLDGAIMSYVIRYELVAALMWGPKSRGELAEYCGADLETIDRHLAQARNAGLIYRCGIRSSPDPVGHRRSGYPEVLHALQRVPHEKSDAVNNRGVPVGETE